MKTKLILLMILSVSVLAACIQTVLQDHHNAPVKPWTITLLITPSGDGTSMRVKTVPMARCINSQNGCMIFSHNETGKITFDMSGNHSGFHFTQLKICKDATPPSPIDKDCPLLHANALDFYVLDSDDRPIIPNLLTGKIEWDYSDAVKSFVLYDRNLLKQEYYYLVIACDGPDDDDNCPLADPPLENKGMN